jgi:ABC-type transport system involved in multi-copper enzyme maturation permease subunit
VRGVFWVLFWNVGLIFLLYLYGVCSALTSSRSGRPAGFWFVMLLMSAVSPYAPIFYEIFQPSMPGQVKVQLFGSAVWAEPWHLYLVLAAALSLGHFLLLLRRARTPEYSGTTRRERRLARKGAHARPVRRSVFTRALISWGDAGAPFLRNPVFLKEIRSEFFSRVWFRRACFWLPLLVFAAIGVVPMRPPESATIIACTAFTLVALIVPAVAASSFPREIEHGNLDFLRGTSLTLREVLTGKFLASLYSCWGIIAAACWVVPAVIMLSSTGRNNWWGWSESDKLELGPSIVCMGLISLAAGLVFVAAAAMLASTLAKRTLSALLLAYSLLFGVFLGWPILASLMLSRSDAVMIATNPYVAIVQATSLSSDTSHDPLHAFFIVHGIAILILWKLSHIFLEAKHARDV